MPPYGAKDGPPALSAAFTGAFQRLASPFATGDADAPGRLRASYRDWLPELGLFLLAAASFMAIRGISLTHDVVWQFWIARQMLGGAVLYRDIWELNPPLWFWSAVPVQFAAEKLSLTTGQLLVPLITAGGAGSALLVGRLGAFGSPARRFVIMALAFWVSVPMPLFDFGQREQIALICSLPYAMLAMRRRERLPTSMAMALLVGLLAAYGFAMKHYFALVPLALEGWAAWTLRRDWRPLRPETAVLAIAALGYGAAILIFAPDFLTHMVPMIAAAYSGYEEPLAKQFDEPAQIVWALGLLALFIDWRANRNALKPQTMAFLLCALGFGAAYFLQRKGWQYHAIPVTGAILLAVASQATASGLARLGRYPVAVLAIAFAMFVGVMQGGYHDYLRRGSEPVIRTVPAGEPIAILAADPMWAWPLVEDHRLVWPLHVYSYWMLPAIGDVIVHHRDRSRIRDLEAQMFARTVEDLRCRPPAVVMIDRGPPRYPLQPRDFDVRGYFMGNAPFARFIAEYYREEAPTRWFHVYRRVGNPAPSGSGRCRTIR